MLTLRQDNCPLACLRYCARIEVGNVHTLSLIWTTFTRATFQKEK